MMNKLLCLGTTTLLCAASSAFAERTIPATFYVDSERGNDSAVGTAEAIAWQSLDKVNLAELIPGDTVLFKRGGLWRGQLVPHSGSNNVRIVYGAYGTGEKPILQGSLARNSVQEWTEAKPGIWRATLAECPPTSKDIGIVILDHGQKWGIKKWKLEDVKAPFDYWYDAENKALFLACAGNPASAFKSIELALTRHIINQGGRHDITYDGLAIRYGAAHGFGGGGTKRLTIRNCDVYWIGGGLQFFKPDGKPVRYGNGIEFWDGAEDHLVEANRIWEIYDAALTNQGNNKNSNQINITYRNNIIWNAEYSFEYWNRPEAAITRNILFEHNTCVDAGYCWSHNQRPDINGAHLMFYHNSANTTNVIVRNNIFVQSTEVCMRMENDWRKGLTMHNNLFFQSEKPVIRWLIKTYYKPADFARYQTEVGMDKDSLMAEPLFVNPAARDYRLKPNSPGATLATDHGPVGAR